MSDPEGDSTMHSSPSNDDDEMFPDEAISNNTATTTIATPSTPHHPSLASTSLSELSPPNSQSQSQSRDPSTLTKGINGNGKRPPSAAENAMQASSGNGGAHYDPETGYSWSRTEDQPGFEWRSNRAREDEMRALDLILDLGRQVKTKYGDPLDATVPAKGRR